MTEPIPPFSRTLDEVLWSVSDAIYPDSLGEKPVEVNCHGADGDTPLHVLAWRDDTEGAAILVAAGANVNALGDMGETPLHVAARQGNAVLLDLLLRAGGDPSLRSEFGLTVRELAAGRGGAVARVVFGG